MKIHETPNYVRYMFTSPLYIDSNMNATMNTLEHDRFKIIMEKNNIFHYEQTSVVDDKHLVTVTITILAKYHTQGFEYDLLTLLMENRKG